MLEQLERQETREQVTIPQLEIAPLVPTVENDQRQRRRMVIALAMLLVALALVLVKDRDFWFSGPETTDSEAVDDSAATDATSDAAAPASTVATPSVPAARKKSRTAAPVPPSKSMIPEAAANPAIPATRAALAPLRVEVMYGGDRHQAVRAGSPSFSVELQNGAPGRAASVPASSETEVASAGNTPVVNAGLTHTVRPEYPLLARQMKVQGRVELDAQIGRDGGVQALQVVGGPAILADAAREAVKQWRFKPYFQNGQPVETQVPITVNFTIQTGK